MESLKKEFLELLERDVEFRYAVAGYLGLSEVLKRLDAMSKEQTKIWREIKGLREEQTNVWREIRELRTEQVKTREEQTKIWEEIRELRGEQTKIWREIRKLRDDFNRMFKLVDLRLSRVERTLEKLTVDIEEEARSIIRHRLKTDLGLEMEIGSLILPELELNIYGVSDEVCVVGEATVRGGAGVINELLEKIKLLKSRYPDKLRRKTIPVIYVCLPLPELIREAKERSIWVLKATQDYYKPSQILNLLNMK